MKIIRGITFIFLALQMNGAFAKGHPIPDTVPLDSYPVTDDTLTLGPDERPDLFREEDYQTVMGLDDYYRQLLEYRKAAAEFKARATEKEANDEKARQVEDKNEKPRSVTVDVDQSSQRMNVSVNKKMKYAGWKVSTGKPGLGTTPNGEFRPFEMNKNYHSRRFNVILPNGIKFQGGNLIHAASTGGINYLGQKRSHGCIRLHPLNAKILFDLVKLVGLDNTLVVVHN